MNKPYSLRNSLIITVSILTLLPLLVAAIISLVMFNGETTARIRMENLKVAQTVATALELFSARPVVMLKLIRDDVNKDRGEEFGHLIHVANRTHEIDPLFESIQFVDSRGDLVGEAGESSATDATHNLTQKFSDSELFKQVKKTDQAVWSEPFVSLKSGESVISVALPWKDGMICGTMNLSYLIRLVEPTKTSLNAYAFIVSPEGRLIAHPDRTLVGEKEAFISIPQITAGFTGASGTYNFNISNRAVIGSVLPFKQNGWVIVAVHDKAKAFASLYRMEGFLGGLTFLVLASALFYSVRSVKSITAPICALSRFTGSIARGALVSMPFESSPYSEVDELYTNFRTMAGAVVARERDLRERNEELAVTEGELRKQVADHLQTYDALSTEKAKLDSILASMGEGLSILSLDYKVLLQNLEHKKLIGEAVGKYCYEAYGHNVEVCEDCPLKLSLADGATHTRLRPVQREGREIYFEISASPLRNSSGEITGGIEIFRDVTAKVLADQEIWRLNQELEAKVKSRTAELEMANRELEAFSYLVSHDLRAPLRHISSFSTILESDYADKLDNDGKHYLTRIVAGCNKMEGLIDDLLELAQVSASEFKFGQVNLTRIANVIAASLAEREPDRQVRFEVENGLIVHGDERLLEIMMNNLLGNAWKYTEQKEAAIIEFSSKSIAGRPVFLLRDNGTGFDNRYAGKLFTPFQRLHGAEYEGTGVGLAIVQRIIHRHNGKIWADAVAGEGANFYFTLLETDRP